MIWTGLGFIAIVFASAAVVLIASGLSLAAFTATVWLLDLVLPD